MYIINIKKLFFTSFKENKDISVELSFYMKDKIINNLE